MATQPTTSTPPPSLSSFLTVSQDWLGDDYAGLVVKQVLDARDQIPPEVKRALDSAIRNSGVRVPGAQFQHKDVEAAPSHHLQTPVLRKMQSSDELTEAILRAWVGIQGELYESVVQHLQWNDEPTYGPDRQEMCFRGFWDAQDWQTNYNQFLADRTGFNRNDVGLMLWYVSGKLPPPHAAVMSPLEQVDFEQWKELLLALRPDAPQWEQALDFASVIVDIVAEKEQQRARDAVKHLKAKVSDIWLEYSDELAYLERNMAHWGAARNIEPGEALESLARANNLESLLSQYRPIRDQAQSRSVESSRAGRRAELEAEIIATVAELEGVFDPAAGSRRAEPAPSVAADKPEEEPAPAREPAAGLLPGLSDTGEMTPSDGLEELLPAPSDTGEMAPADRCEELLPVELTGCEAEPPAPAPASESLSLLPDISGEGLLPPPELLAHPPEAPSRAPETRESAPEALTPAPSAPEKDMPEIGAPEVDTLAPGPGPVQSADVNTTILAGLQSLRNDLEQLKEQLSVANSPGANSAGSPVQEPEALEEGLTLDPADGPRETGLSAAVAQAREWYANRLLFRLNSESWVEGNPYEDHQSVSDALEWLASTYFSARQGPFDPAYLSESLYRACRWKYSSNRSDGSFFQTEGHYRMLVNGRAYFLNETIGKGVGEDPVNTIRIAFYWDRQRERVVIGYIGQHKPDANP